MKARFICAAGVALLAGGAMWHVSGADPRTAHTVPVDSHAQAAAAKREAEENANRTVQPTAGRQIIRQYQGNMTLEKAVEIALAQNPDILNAIQEIERTRGIILEVRGNALPQITITGDYDQQDKRLLRGGGFTGGSSSGGITNLPTTSIASTAPSTSQTATGFVGNTNTTGTDLSTGGTDATGGTTGLTAARARHPAAAVISGGGGTTSTGTSGSTSSDNSSSNANLSQQLQQALNDSTNQNNVQDKSWNITVEVEQPLYTGGQLSAAIRIAKLAQDSSYFELRDTVDRVIAQVREQFYTVLLNRALITVAEEAVRLAEEQLQDQRFRYEAGTVPKFNVLRAEVEVANEQPVLIRARNDYLLAQIQLGKSLGLNPGAGARPEFNCVGELTVSGRQMSLVDAVALARARRPYLKVQRQAILIDVEQIKVELAGYKPQLFAHGGYEFRNRSSAEDLSDVANGWFFGVTGNWSIFDGFQTYGRVKQARARLEQSKISYDDSVREVDLEVQTAYANLDQARQTIESQRKNVEEALEALRLAQDRFANGAGTQLEVLDARVALTRARTTELQSRSDYNRGLAEFDRATGTQTVYHESFKDPLSKTQKGILARIAETGLPKIGDSEH